MPKSPVWNMFALAVAMPLAAGAANPPPQTGIAPPTRISSVPPSVAGPIGEQIPSATVPRDVRRAVVADAAKRFKVKASAVVLARAEKVTWNDGSLGCPEPGHMYAQLLVPGFRVLARTHQGSFTYHTDNNGNVRICLDSTPLPMMDTEPQPYPPKQAAPEK